MKQELLCKYVAVMDIFWFNNKTNQYKRREQIIKTDFRFAYIKIITLLLCNDVQILLCGLDDYQLFLTNQILLAKLAPDLMIP